MGIKEALEIFDAAIAICNDVAEAKADGELSTMELLKVAIGNAPASVRAVMGAESVVAEMKDLDKDEAKLLASKGMELSQAVMRLFGKVA